MKHKPLHPLAFTILIGIVFSSCTHTIIRTGYQVDKSRYQHCDIVISKDASLAQNASSIGKIRLDDSGVSMKCNQAQAYQILKNEGCALNADLIIINWEGLPGLISTCYRCEATFYKTDGSTNVPGDQAASVDNDMYYFEEPVEDRPGRRVLGAVVGGVLGFALGFGIMTIVLSGT